MDGSAVDGVYKTSPPGIHGSRLSPGRRGSWMRENFQPAVYIMASRRHGTLYIGVTSNLLQRIDQHRNGLLPGFTRDYAVNRLVWFGIHETMESAILREKRLKDWRRAWKIVLIETTNPEWLDLAIDLGLPRLD
jgi:putative endonuclease